MAKLIVSFAFVVGGLLLPLSRAQAFIDPTCKSKGLFDGYSSGTKCWADKTGAGALKEDCDPNRNACCSNISGNAVCVRILATDAPFVPAPVDTYRPIEEKSKKAAEDIQRKQLEFTPNVPIPNLFEGVKLVDSTLFAKYLGAFYVYFIGVISILAVAVMMWGGYHYITSFGNPQKMNQGKEIISNAVIGLVIAITSFLLLRLINPALVSFPGLVPSYVREALQPFEKLARPMKSGSRVDVSPASLATIVKRVKSGGYDQLVKTEADAKGLGPDFKYRLMTLLFIESAAYPKAVSPVGACGLVQLLPSTAGVSSCEPLFDPAFNIKKAAEFYASITKNPCPAYTAKVAKKNPCPAVNPCNKDDRDLTFATAAYNGGRGANYCSQSCSGQTWWQCEENEGYEETRNYVEKAKKTYTWLKDTKNFTF